MAVAVERQRRVGHLLASLRIGQERLDAARRPAHRPRQPARCPQHQHILGERVVAHAERAAALPRHDMDVVRLGMQHRQQPLAQAVRGLGADAQMIAALRLVEPCERRARFHRDHRHARDREPPLDHMPRPGECRLHRLFVALLDEERDVAIRHLVPHLGSARRESGGRVDHGILALHV